MPLLKQNLKTLLVGIILASQTLKAASCPNATYLDVGDTVKDCPRVGLSVDYELQVRKDLIEGDYNKKILIEKDQLLGAKDLRIDYLQKETDLWHNEALRERALVDNKTTESKRELWYGFGLGILSVLVGAWSVGQVK